MRMHPQDRSSVKAWLISLCLGLFLHAVWIGGQSEVNILDHVAHGEIEHITVGEPHAHADDHNDRIEIGMLVDNDSPMDMHHHHHFSETPSSLVPATAYTFSAISPTAVHALPGDLPAPDGVRPSGPFQPPRA